MRAMVVRWQYISIARGFQNFPSEDTSLKLNFNRRKLTQVWLSVQQTCPTLSTEALKVLLPFSSSYICEVGFSAMVKMKTKFRNRLQLSNALCLKITRIDVYVNAVISSNLKQAHQSHSPHYEKQIEFFVKLYSIINNLFFYNYFFLARKPMCVAIDCRSKNWVALLKSLGSTDVYKCRRLRWVGHVGLSPMEETRCSKEFW
jgi:hypothetical protein